MRYKIFEYKNEIGEKIKLSIRNVGSKNPKAQLQIEIDRTRLNGREYHSSISVPSNLVSDFLAACKNN